MVNVSKDAYRELQAIIVEKNPEEEIRISFNGLG